MNEIVDAEKLADPEDQRIMRMIALGRQHGQTGEMATAAIYYEAVFDATKDLKTPIQRVARGEACAFRAEAAMNQNMFGTAVDWYLNGLIADPLSEELRILYLNAAARMRERLDRQIAKMEEQEKA